MRPINIVLDLYSAAVCLILVCYLRFGGAGMTKCGSSLSGCVPSTWAWRWATSPTGPSRGLPGAGILQSSGAVRCCFDLLLPNAAGVHLLPRGVPCPPAPGSTVFPAGARQSRAPPPF